MLPLKHSQLCIYAWQRNIIVKLTSLQPIHTYRHKHTHSLRHCSLYTHTDTSTHTAYATAAYTHIQTQAHTQLTPLQPIHTYTHKHTQLTPQQPIHTQVHMYLHYVTAMSVIVCSTLLIYTMLQQCQL